MLVYQSQSYDLNEYQGVIRLMNTKDIHKEDEYITWIHKGDWDNYIITELKKLEEKVSREKVEIRKKQQIEENKKRVELENKKSTFKISLLIKAENSPI